MSDFNLAWSEKTLDRRFSIQVADETPLLKAIKFQHGNIPIYPVKRDERKDTNNLSKSNIDVCQPGSGY